MKKNYLMIAALAVCVSSAMMTFNSCTKETEVKITDVPEEKVPVLVSLPELQASVKPLGSKALSVDGEKTVNSLQVFAFRTPTGEIDAYSKSATSTLNLSCTVGKRNFYAVVNAPDLTDVQNESAFLAKVSDLKDNAPDNLVMTGKTSKDISASSNEVPIEVTRLVARVSIDKISNALSLPQYASVPISIDKIYLATVAGDRKYMSDSAPVKWYNKGGVSSDCPSVLSSGSLTATVSNGAAYETPHYFYCYPNDSGADASSGTWTASSTKLIVETTILGTKYYYPFGFPDIKSNMTYTIEELKITRLGSSEPETPVSTGTVSVTLTITEWKTGTSTTVVI